MAAVRWSLLRVVLPPEGLARVVELIAVLMGRRPELRFCFIQDHVARLAAEALDA